MWYCESCGNEFEAGETESTICPECSSVLIKIKWLKWLDVVRIGLEIIMIF